MTDIHREALDTPMTWTSTTLLDNDGRIELGAKHLDELCTVAAQLAQTTALAQSLRKELFDMPACATLMTTVREQLNTGIGFAIIDRLPLERFDDETATRLYWLLMQHIGQPVAQKWDGTLIYQVTDTRATTAAGNGVRSSKTNAGQRYHVDNAFNLPPNFVGLLCLQSALSGGVSGLISFETLYNRLLERFPQVLPRLYEPFWFDRQHEHGPNDAPVNQKPMIEWEQGTIAFNFSPRIVRQGYEVAGVVMDEAAERALDAVQQVAESADMGKSFEFERGQIQIINNRRLGHRRSAYTDHPQAHRRRHLLRIWIRDRGRACYSG